MVIRPNADQVLGGDTVQMRQTSVALRRLGVEVSEAIGAPTDEQLKACDLVHLFNLHTPDFTLAAARQIKAAKLPFALSTIYWDFGPDRLVIESSKLRLIRKLFGLPAAYDIARRRHRHNARFEHDKIREILSLADAHLPNSNLEAEMVSRFGVSDRLVQVVPNGVDSERYGALRNLPMPSALLEKGINSKEYLLIVARLDPDKNQLEFCRATQGKGIPIVLCGPAPDAAYLQACRETGVSILPQASGDDLDALMLHARVHALPSWRETPGLANLEAAALGCQIVSTKMGSAYEYFEDLAFYCDPASHVRMRLAVEDAWEAESSDKLRNHVLEYFTWDIAAKKTLEAYRAILNT